MDWQPEDVARWVGETLQLPQHADKFVERGISGPTLLENGVENDETLLQNLGVENVFHRKKLRAHINMLRSGIVAGDGLSSGRGGRPASGRVGGRPASGAGTPRMPGGGYPVGSVGSGVESASTLPRGGTGSIQRSYSVDSRGDGGSLSGRRGQEGSVYSCYINPDLGSRGRDSSRHHLTSYFGIDSPSYSRSGSMPREGLAGSGKGRNDLWRTAAKSAAAGPGSYDIPQMVGRRNAAGSLTSPRAKFGSAQRKTMEYVAPNVRDNNYLSVGHEIQQRKKQQTSMSPCAGSYDPQRYTDIAHSNGPIPNGRNVGSDYRQKGPSMGRSPRLNYKGSHTKHWISEDQHTPGPTDYLPQPTANTAWRG